MVSTTCVIPLCASCVETALTCWTARCAVLQEEAIACFQRALEADPQCAMAHWGVAYSHGPNYNFHASNGYYVVSRQESGFPSMKCAFDSVRTAASLTANVTPVEKDLIEALQLLYCWPASAYAEQLGVAYSNAMRAVHERHSDDADVAFLGMHTLSSTCKPAPQPQRTSLHGFLYGVDTHAHAHTHTHTQQWQTPS